MSYRAEITEQDIRDITGLSTAEASDALISGILTHSIVQFNHDVGVKYKDWRVEYVSNERENKLDGTNATFYTKNWPLGDYNDDGEITTSDVSAYTISSDGTRTAITVSTIDSASLGKFTLASTPDSSSIFYVSYTSSPVDLDPLDNLAKLAIIRLTASIVYTNLDAGKIAGFRVGRVSITKQSKAFAKYYDDYKNTIRQIRSKAIKHGKFKLVL